VHLAFRAGSTVSPLHHAIPSPPDYVETRPPFQIFPPKFLRGAGRSIPEGNTLRIRRVSRSSTSTSNRRLIGMDPFLESLRFAANCRVHVGRVLGIGSRTSGSE